MKTTIRETGYDICLNTQTSTEKTMQREATSWSFWVASCPGPEGREAGVELTCDCHASWDGVAKVCIVL